MKLIDIGGDTFVDPDKVMAVFNNNPINNQVILSDGSYLCVYPDDGVCVVDDLKRIVETINNAKGEA